MRVTIGVLLLWFGCFLSAVVTESAGGGVPMFIVMWAAVIALSIAIIVSGD